MIRFTSDETVEIGEWETVIIDLLTYLIVNL